MNIRQLRFFLQIAELGSMTRAATFLHIAQPALSRQIQQLEGRIGERVWIWNGQWKRPHGTAAEYIVLPTAQAVPLPGNVSYAEGACLGIPAFTAVQAVRLAALTHGTTVLIAGGAGSVAHYAIQLAKRRGATVITTASSDVKGAHARRAGADHVINYKTDNVPECIQAITYGHGVDAVIELDLSANARLYPSILRRHATVVVYGMAANETTLPSLWLMQNSIALRLFLIYDISETDRSAGIDELTRLLAEGRLVHSVARRLPLGQIADAHEIVERGEVIGNLVLDIPSEVVAGG